MNQSHLEPARYASSTRARSGRLQVVRGAIALNGYALTAGDGVAIGGQSDLKIEADRAAISKDTSPVGKDPDFVTTSI
jgi:hypothetical protein